MNDVRQWIYGAIIGLLACIGLMLSIVYVSACGFTLTCVQANPLVIRTPIPTLIPAVHAEDIGSNDSSDFGACQVLARELIGAWAMAGAPETESFPFPDVNGDPCVGTFDNDVQHLFVENNLWEPDALGCTSCHNASLNDRSSGLDLSSHQSILMGTRRVPEATSPGTDLFGRGVWEDSLLYDVLFNQGLTPDGHSPDVPPPDTIVYAGQQVAEFPATATPTAPPTARPTATLEATATATP